MNNDIFAGQWKEMRGALRSWWGKLTDDDLERIGGEKDKLIGVMQEKYGYTRDQAQSEIERRFNEYDGSDAATGGSAASGIVNNMKSKAHELSVTAASKARDATAGVKSGLDTAESYLKEHKVKSIAADLGALVRKHPVPSVLIGLGLVYLLSRSRSE
jgi:uncharacterized protein YjbJ (UPF0337 family)